MSLEFAVQYPCVLRVRYSEKHLRERGRLSNLHTRLTTGDTSVPSEDKLRWVENASEKISPTAITKKLFFIQFKKAAERFSGRETTAAASVDKRHADSGPLQALRSAACCPKTPAMICRYDPRAQCQ